MQPRSASRRGSQVYGVNFDHADLRHADFKGANIRESNFNYACLTDARFRDAFVGQSSLGEVRTCEEQARALVDEHWSTIRAVAAALAASSDGCLDAARVRDFIGGT
jgi:Pentapeptide repeats (8 copies)